jgi:hypothetical protein
MAAPGASSVPPPALAASAPADDIVDLKADTHLLTGNRITLMRRLTTVVAGFVLLAAARVPLAAQTFPTDDPVLKKIWDIGMNGSQTERLAQALLDSIGPRLTGSPGQKAGNAWLVKMYNSWGIDAKNEQYGTWRGWRRGTSHIDLMTPRVRSLEGTMLAYSPGTGGKPVTGPVVMLPLFKDSTEFVKWLPQAKGKYVLLNGRALPSCRPSSDWVQFGTKESKARVDSIEAAVYQDWDARIKGTQYSFGLSGGALSKRLDAAGVAGSITTRMSDQPQIRPGAPIVSAAGIGMAGTWPIFETYALNSPSVALSCEDYGLLARLAENNQHPTIRVTADAQLMGEVPVYNTIATVKGGEKADEIVMFSAHFDSWDAGSGATDNGTGTLVMLEAMRILHEAYPHPKRTLMAGHWSSEEQGLNGSTAWSADHPEVVAKLQALFNQDNGTGRIRSVGASGLPDMEKHLADWKAKLPHTDLTDSLRTSFSTRPPSPGGTDGTVFGCRGAPHFGLGAVGWNYGPETWHTNRDTYDKVVFDDLKFNATLTAMLAYLASEDPTFIDRTKVEGNWPASCGNPPRSTRAR